MCSEIRTVFGYYPAGICNIDVSSSAFL